MFRTEPFYIVYVQYEYILFYFVLFNVLCFNLETINKDWYCGNITASICVSAWNRAANKYAKKNNDTKQAYRKTCSRYIYFIFLFFAGAWPVSASEHLSSELPAFPFFRSGSCCCSIPAVAHRHSSSLWGVQSCCGSTEEKGKLIFKPHHENGVGKKGS